MNLFLVVVMSLVGLLPIVLLRDHVLPLGSAPAPTALTSWVTATPLPPFIPTLRPSPSPTMTPTDAPTATPTATAMPSSTPTSLPAATPAPSPTEAPVATASAAAPPGTWVEWAHGVATWYDGAGAPMRNGEPLDLDGLTCAVDAAAWAELNGKQVRIRLQGGGDEGVVLRVTDTGNLTAAGCYSVDPATYRVTQYAGSGECQHIVVDLPRGTFQTYLGSGMAAVVVEVQVGD
ncbi:MAG TPA: hypothetical protein PLJ35_08190 [Anaerolineae bacterium]|nr:hypothetical protein [Anaerolineae bacterium]HPL29149.1 hypothetical protein [Anaerolineae bacterium]